MTLDEYLNQDIIRLMPSVTLTESDYIIVDKNDFQATIKIPKLDERFPDNDFRYVVKVNSKELLTLDYLKTSFKLKNKLVIN